MKLPEDLPTTFLQRMQEIIPLNYFETFLASFSIEKTTSFRVNTIKTSIEATLKRLSSSHLNLTPISWCKEGFSIPPQQRTILTGSTEFEEGLIYIQNPSSMFVSLVLDPSPGEEILDLAAAPGGKTLHMAALMQNKGRIAAVEAVKERFFRLKDNIKRSGAAIIQPYYKDGSTIGRLVPERFDRVLLDAPCSSEGRFNLNKLETLAYWSEKKIAEMVRKQKKLIYSAIQCLKPNGILVYSTCSFAPEENEEIVQHALKKFGEQIEILPIQAPFENKQSGLTTWQNKKLSPHLAKTIRILPNQFMNGFYICKIRKVY